MKLENVKTATPELLKGVQRLLPQLTDSGHSPGMADLESMIRGDASSLIVVRDGDEADLIVGMGTVAVYRTPTGLRAIIEDVIVDAAFRGRGYGEALVRALMDLALKNGAQGVGLTSNPRARLCESAVQAHWVPPAPDEQLLLQFFLRQADSAMSAAHSPRSSHLATRSYPMPQAAAARAHSRPACRDPRGSTLSQSPRNEFAKRVDVRIRGPSDRS